MHDGWPTHTEPTACNKKHATTPTNEPIGTVKAKPAAPFTTETTLQRISILLAEKDALDTAIVAKLQASHGRRHLRLRAKAIAIASPIPLLLPVTNAVLSLSCRSIVRSPFQTAEKEPGGS
jgi:hypothetical protein